ncbi:MAG TPA: 3'-5' exonuclease, partial [Candidatus Bathyarchaeia archaeon]|nr:3'-5' exonuclease [Candidatus Bathyarchaeia archaeon]
MKVKFWLLDLNVELSKDVAEIWLWGIDHSGRRVLVIDKTFSAYFYALIEDGANAIEIVDKITKQNDPFIVKLEIVERRFFGKPVKAIKVYCKSPDVLSKSAEALRKFEGVKDCLEDDIRSSMRYLIDNNIAPSSWHEVEVEEAVDSVKAQVDHVYVAKCPPRPLSIAEAPQLRILGFSTLCYSGEGSPKAERNPVIVVSVATNHGEEKQFMANEKREDKPVLEAFVNYVRSFNPDIIVGYGVNGQEWPYLKKRCEVLGLHLNVDRTETEPHQSTYGHISVTGRANIDLLDYADDFPEVKVKTLANLADHLSVMKIADRTIVEETDFADYWDDLEKREVLKRFSMDNVRCVMGIAEAVLNFGMQLSSLVDLPLDHVGTAAAGFRV